MRISMNMNCEVQEQQQKQQQAQKQQLRAPAPQQQHQQQQQQQQQSNKLYARKPKQPQQQESSDDDDDDEESCTTMPAATTTNITASDELSIAERKNLEFAQKLGYSEQSIHIALTRLASGGHTEAKQNELLAELIKLTADAPRPAPNNHNHINSNNQSNLSNGVSLPSTLRHIVIDGSNVALSHGNNTVFSCRGIRICVDWFRQRGHRHITAFVPSWRKESSRSHNKITEQELLYELERERVLVFTPSRHLDGKRVACYDDRYILKLAASTDGIVVSNDNYRDLLLESNEYRKVVQERLLMYTFVNDRFMPPDDPLGRAGPTLDMFLRSQTAQKMADAQQLCPYGKKCTYGQKCKYRHTDKDPNFPIKRLPLQASHSAPLHSNGQQLLVNGSSSAGGGSVLNNNNNYSAKLTTLTTREPLGRTTSNTLDKMPYEQQQQNQQQLCSAFNSQLELSCDAEPQPQNQHKKLQRQQAPTTHAYRHQQLVPTYSAPLMPPYHQHLTRTPSAPASDASLAPPAHHMAHLSASDSRINEELQTREEKRRLLCYHLSSLFPQHQVHAVLHMYPEETNAKTICAAILNLFPHN